MEKSKKRAIFVLAQKGGVGKTFFTRGLTELYRSAGLSTAIYDCDPRVGQLQQYYGLYTEGGDPVNDALSGVGSFDIRNPRERDGLINAIHTGADVILMDLPGGTVDEIGKVLGSPDALFKVYAENEYEVIVVVLIDVLKASTNTVMDAIGFFGDSASYVVIKNGGTGGSPQPEHFRTYDGYDDGITKSSGKARQMVESMGGETIFLKPLDAQTIQWLDEFNYTFGQGVAHRSSLGNAHRCAVWLKGLEESLSEGRLAVKPRPSKVKVAL